MLPPGGHFGCQFQAFANISKFQRKIAILKSCQYSGGTLVVLWWYSGGTLVVLWWYSGSTLEVQW